jgi:hypothetical protein
VVRSLFFRLLTHSCSHIMRRGHCRAPGVGRFSRIPNQQREPPRLVRVQRGRGRVVPEKCHWGLTFSLAPMEENHLLSVFTTTLLLYSCVLLYHACVHLSIVYHYTLLLVLTRARPVRTLGNRLVGSQLRRRGGYLATYVALRLHQFRLMGETKRFQNTKKWCDT